MDQDFLLLFSTVAVREKRIIGFSFNAIFRLTRRIRLTDRSPSANAIVAEIRFAKEVGPTRRGSEQLCRFSCWQIPPAVHVPCTWPEKFSRPLIFALLKFIARYTYTFRASFRGE